MSIAQRHTQRFPDSLTLTRKTMSVLPISRLEPINDAMRREARQPGTGKKLLMICMMFSLITYLIWSMG